MKLYVICIVKTCGRKLFWEDVPSLSFFTTIRGGILQGKLWSLTESGVWVLERKGKEKL